MAIGITNGSLSEDEKKRREKFAANAPKLGMVPNTAAEAPAVGNVNAPKLGMVPNVSDKTIADEYSSKTAEGNSKIWRGNPDKKPFGLSVVSAPDHQPSMSSVNPSQVNRVGFGMPNAPRLSWGEKNERDNLLTKIGTPHKGSQNGQLTAKQMELMADIGGRDQKYANDQYGTQVNAASQLAQTQMSQDGANSRAVLGEAGSDKRFNTQFGFDVKKAQAENDVAQQKLGFDAQKAQAALDINRYNADTSRMRAETGQQSLDKKGVLTEKERNERIGEYRRTSASLDGALELADDMIANTDGLAGNVGAISTYTPNFKDTTRKFNSDRKALLSQAFLANSDLLSGVLTDMDAKELKNAFGNLQDTTISEADYAKNLAKARALMQKTRDSTDERYQDVIPYINKQGADSQPIDDEEKIRNQELGNKYFGG